MNDNNVIIQALEHCVNDATCDKCPFKNPEHNGCKYTANDFNSIVLDFIKHQMARIEMLVEQNVRLNKECDHYIDFASIAIKEFAEKLREQQYYGEDLSGMYGTHVVEVETIDDLVKEMTNQSIKENEYGHWTRELIRNDKGGCVGAMMICSHCKKDNRHDEHMQYCPNCGKKMDKEIIHEQAAKDILSHAI